MWMKMRVQDAGSWGVWACPHHQCTTCGRKAAAGIIEVNCLGVCPRGAVTVVNGAAEYSPCTRPAEGLPGDCAGYMRVVSEARVGAGAAATGCGARCARRSRRRHGVVRFCCNHRSFCAASVRVL